MVTGELAARRISGLSGAPLDDSPEPTDRAPRAHVVVSTIVLDDRERAAQPARPPGASSRIWLDEPDDPSEARAEVTMLTNVPVRRRGGLAAIGAIVLTVGVAAAVWVMSRGPDRDATVAESPAPLPAPLTTVPASQPPIDPPPAPAPAAPAPAAVIELTFRSSPPGAEVRAHDADTVLGTTPFTITLPREDGGTRTFEFTLAGHTAVSEQIGLEKDGTIAAALAEIPKLPPVPNPPTARRPGGRPPPPKPPSQPSELDRGATIDVLENM